MPPHVSARTASSSDGTAAEPGRAPARRARRACRSRAPGRCSAGRSDRTRARRRRSDESRGTACVRWRHAAAVRRRRPASDAGPGRRRARPPAAAAAESASRRPAPRACAGLSRAHRSGFEAGARAAVGRSPHRAGPAVRRSTRPRSRGSSPPFLRATVRSHRADRRSSWSVRRQRGGGRPGRSRRDRPGLPRRGTRRAWSCRRRWVRSVRAPHRRGPTARRRTAPARLHRSW